MGKNIDLKSEGKRTSNLELLRIIMMILLVASHYVHNSGILETINDGGTSLPKTIIILVFGMWGKPIINGFVMITSYFLCVGKIKLEKALKLIFELLFYNIVIYLIFVVSGYTKITVGGIITNLFPIKNFSTNFMPMFILFYLLIPFLNILIHHMTQRQHLGVVVLLGFLYVFLGTLPKLRVAFNYVTWFSFIFIFVSYFRLYKEKLIRNKKIWLVMLFITYIISLFSIFGGYILSQKTGLNTTYWLLEDSNKVLALVLSFSLFCVFLNLKIPYSRFINSISKCTLGVLLIHANSDLMRNWLWKDTLKCVDAFNNDYFLIHAILSVITVYLLCTAIEFIRIKVLDKPIDCVCRRVIGIFKRTINKQELT